MEITSGHCQCSEFVFSNGKSSTIVSSDAHHIPSGGIQVKHHEIATWFNIVRYLMPLSAIPTVNKSPFVASNDTI